MGSSQDSIGVGLVQSVLDLGKWQLGAITDAILVFYDYLWLLLISVILLVTSQHMMKFLEKVQDKTRDEAFSFAERVFEKHTTTIGGMIQTLNRLQTDPAIVRELQTLNSNLNSLTSLLNEHVRRNLGPIVNVSGPAAPPPPPPPLPPLTLFTPQVSRPISTPASSAQPAATPHQNTLLITKDELQKTIQSLKKTKSVKKSRSPAKKLLFRKSFQDKGKRRSTPKGDRIDELRCQSP